MNRPNVLLIIPNLGKGGAQQVFYDQLAFFSQHATVTGCVFNWDDSFAEDQVLNIQSLDIPAGKNVLSKFYFFLKRVNRVRKIKRDRQIDISISHLEGADYINILSRRSEKIILWIHGTKKFDNEIEGVTGLVRKRVMIPILYERANLIVSVSEGIRNELIREFDLPSGKVRTISNGIALQDIAPLSTVEDLSFPADLMKPDLTLITHCRLARQKNIGALIRIFAKVKSTLPVKLVIVGDGELRDQLIEQSKSLQLKTFSCWEKRLPERSDDIFFVGYQRNPYQYLAKATLYVMTSLWEGFPLSMCEAMACQIPVMAADCYTGPREILAPGIQAAIPVALPFFSSCGVLMPLANSDFSIQLWADTICVVLRNEELRIRMILEARERAKEFDKGKIEIEWLDLLTDNGANR